jgi:hypothetical protein
MRHYRKHEQKYLDCDNANHVMVSGDNCYTAKSIIILCITFCQTPANIGGAAKKELLSCNVSWRPPDSHEQALLCFDCLCVALGLLKDNEAFSATIIASNRLLYQAARCEK